MLAKPRTENRQEHDRPWPSVYAIKLTREITPCHWVHPDEER
jgi:hypothetical protein